MEMQHFISKHAEQEKTLDKRDIARKAKIISRVSLILCLIGSSVGCISWSDIRERLPKEDTRYPYSIDYTQANRVADALRIAKLRIEQLNLSGGGDCIPGRIYRMQQLAYRVHREHLSGLDQDALHNLRILDQQINETEYGLRYLQTRTTCIENKPDRQLTAMQPLLDRLSEYSFEFDRQKMPEQMQEPLLALIHWLKEHPVYRVELTGHTDSIGTEAHNAGLALRRANTIAAYLRQEDIPEHQILINGLGEHEPVASNAKDRSRSQNRRVSFQLRLLLERNTRSQKVKNWPGVTDLWGGY